ncbi:hypothetical protein BpHYR1_029697 [Brachionus plicatilis]|uniref:Uncharacterized protein n=1 Tax=Brachionus plicatilis TaxID=10195 RepID=A0A3M7T3F6_BRAPC|nr:hypothetical protein BpHYR1_029697 [Brachionus plicatilis]
MITNLRKSTNRIPLFSDACFNTLVHDATNHDTITTASVLRHTLAALELRFLRFESVLCKGIDYKIRCTVLDIFVFIIFYVKFTKFKTLVLSEFHIFDSKF